MLAQLLYLVGEGDAVAYVLKGSIFKRQRSECFLGSFFIIFPNVSRDA